MSKITIIGNAIIDVIAAKVSKDILINNSTPVNEIKMTFGGDALNEATILSRLGKNVEIITKTGDDDAGKRVSEYLKSQNIDTRKIVCDDKVPTSVNIVLVDEGGERHFVTNPCGSQRKLSLKDIEEQLDNLGDIVSFASIFVSTDLSVDDMTNLFKQIKKNNCILTADMTKAKHGEKLEDLKEMLKYVDYLFPNEEEIAVLTGINNPVDNALLLMQYGVKHPVIKCGANGCVIGNNGETEIVPAFKVKECIDTTGAGDCFVAGFLYALSQGYALNDCCAFANAAGALAVGCVGATDGISSINDIMDIMNWII